MEESIKSKTINGFIWKVLQQTSTQVVNFVISIVLARLISPEDYGIVAITTVFISICNVVINTGFSSSVVQKKQLSQLELSSVFYLSVLTSVVLYLVLFIAAPFITKYYEEPIIETLLRVQSLSMIIASIASVPYSLLNRELKFKNVFIISLIGAGIHGVVGIIMALTGYGVWALVIPSILSTSVTCILYFISSKWFPSLIFSIGSVGQMFGFSIKILFSNVLNTVYKNIQSLIIGKVYSKESLGYFNKGSQFPTIIMGCIDTSMNTVLFSTLSKVQDSHEQSLAILRRSMKTSMYVCAPLMMGLAVVAEPMVYVLLTEKWASCIPFVQIMAITCMTYPLSARLQAINAIGKSSVTFAINLVTNIIAVIMMLIATRFDITIFALANLAGCIIEVVITTFVSSRLLNYDVGTFIKDIFPALSISLVMGAIVWTIGLLDLSYILTLVIQITVGIVVYIGLSYVFHIESFGYLINSLKAVFHKNGK